MAIRLKLKKRQEIKNVPSHKHIHIYIYICSFPVCTQNKPAPLERLFTALLLNFKAI